MPDQELAESKPLEKREIRGLTLESLLRYGAMLAALLFTAWKLNSKVENSSAEVDKNRSAIEKLEKRVELLETRQATDDIKNARFEEQLKNK